MKKLPIIGLLIGAVAAMFAMKKKQHGHEEAPAEEASSSD